MELPVEEAIPDIRIEETPAPEQPQVVAAVSPPVSVADIEEEVPMVENDSCDSHECSRFR